MKRKGYIAERDVNQLLKRYETSTILSLLYEVSKWSGAELNWNQLVKETNTGIKNPREYQALWRHLAYRKELDPDGEEFPLEDDDSDLEFEVEASPVVALETAAEASNYVKALMGFSTDIVFANSDSPGLGLTSILPGFTSAQAASLESFYKANSAAQAEKKKRKVWSLQEDDELAFAVEKYGEGNWAAISKYVFKQERTAPQLAQRWALVKKRREIISSFQAKQLQVDTDALKRTKATLELAMCEQNGTPMQTSLPKQGQGRTDKPSVSAQRKPIVPTIPRTNSAPITSPAGLQAKPKLAPIPVPAPANVQKPAAPALCVQSQMQTSPLASNSPRAVKAGSGTASGARTVPGCPAARNLSGPDPMVQAAAVAAGARIAPASAATFMKAKNVMHIRPPATLNSSSPSMSNRASPVVHYIRTGSGAPPPILQSLSGKRSTKSTVKNAVLVGNKLVKPSGTTTMSRLGVNSSSREETAGEAKLKRKTFPVGMQCQISSWYEDDTTGLDGKGSPDGDSETEDQVPVSVGVCTSSNESFSQSAGAFTPNGASPLSQSSGQSD